MKFKEFDRNLLMPLIRISVLVMAFHLAIKGKYEPATFIMTTAILLYLDYNKGGE